MPHRCPHYIPKTFYTANNHERLCFNFAFILQVTVNVSGEQNNFSNPTYHAYEQAVEVKSVPVEQNTAQVRKPQHLTHTTLVLSVLLFYHVTMLSFVHQESKWSFFKRKLKPSTTFENPTYSEVRSKPKSSLRERSH